MFWRQTWAVLVKDLTVEWRTRQAFNAVICFAVLVLFIFSFALGPQMARQRDLAAGLLWLAFVFTGLLGLGRTFQVEQENHCLEGLVLLSRTCSAVYIGKVLATMVFLLSVEGMTLGLLAVLYNIDLWRHVPALVLVMGLGTVGFAAIGTLYAAITVQVRGPRDPPAAVAPAYHGAGLAGIGESHRRSVGRTGVSISRRLAQAVRCQ